jgi:hypothetical protein
MNPLAAAMLARQAQRIPLSGIAGMPMNIDPRAQGGGNPGGIVILGHHPIGPNESLPRSARAVPVMMRAPQQAQPRMVYDTSPGGIEGM